MFNFLWDNVLDTPFKSTVSMGVVCLSVMMPCWYVSLMLVSELVVMLQSKAVLWLCVCWLTNTWNPQTLPFQYDHTHRPEIWCLAAVTQPNAHFLSTKSCSIDAKTSRTQHNSHNRVYSRNWEHGRTIRVHVKVAPNTVCKRNWKHIRTIQVNTKVKPAQM